MKPSTAIKVVMCAVLLTLPGSGRAQPVDPSEDVVEDTARLQTLAGILESAAAIEVEIEEREVEHHDAETAEQKDAISAQIEELRLHFGDLQSDFTVLATGIDPVLIAEHTVQDFDWREELEAVFTPMLADLKAASAHPRALEALRGELASYEKRLPHFEEAITTLDRLRAVSNTELVTTQLDELAELWTRQRDELETQLEATRQRLVEKVQEKVGVAQVAGEIVRIFFRQRFANFLFALLAFAGILLALRFLHRLLHRWLLAEESRSRQLIVRCADIAYSLFTLVVAVGALLVVLYLLADWVLLTLTVLILIALAWGARNAVPVFFEQMKLLLNVGAAREGERLVYDGIPWRIASLNFFSELHNPALRGGTLRVPLKDLVGRCSRPASDDELWFPSRIGEWVILDDGVYGKLIEQTPETVVVSTVRESEKHYPTLDYLSLHPKNLSANFFSVNHIVGLDYRYRDIINSEVVAKIKQRLEDGFREQAYGEFLDMVVVEFKEMSASSLDVITVAKFKGGAASEYTEIGWKLQQLALEVCNENQWEIPYQQLVVHQPTV